MKNIRDKVSLISVSDDIEENMLELRDLTKKEALGLLLADKGCEEDIENYKNLNKGIDFLLNAMANNLNIAIQVDPDMDGYFSASLIYQVIYDDFEYENITYILNDERKHGFQIDKIESLVENDIGLLIIPDGGSVEFAPLEAVVNKGIQVLILDHHIIEIEDELESIEDSVALINNQDGRVENIFLSGCGVTYKFVKELVSCCDGDIGNKYLDLVACSIVSDVCSLKYSYENRYYLNEGSKISNITNPFLLEMAYSMNKDKKGKFSIEDIGFVIAPIVNSTIRLGTKKDKENLFNALIGVDDLISHRGKAIPYPKKVRLIGQKYQKQQREEKKKIAEFIRKKNEDDGLQENNVIIYIDKNNDIDKSMTGLVANHLLDFYERPVMIGRLEDGIVSGSGRGYGEMNFKSLCEQYGNFIYLKGHDNAFGMSIKEEDIPHFLERINEIDIIEKKSIKIEKCYEEFVPKEDIRKIASFENLWCSDIKCPTYFLKGIIFYVDDIKKTGNSTYELKSEDGNISVFKYFGSKDWIYNLTHNEYGEEIEYFMADLLVEFRKKYGKSQIVIKELEKISDDTLTTLL